MTSTRRTLPWLWLLVPLACLGFLAVNTAWRVRHIDWVTSLAGGSTLTHDSASTTGYAGGVRALVSPERDPRSLQWIVQTQDMRARGAWRVDQVQYDNAPAGRPVWLTSPYRWWLTAVGCLDAVFSGLPQGAAIERAALWADPVLHGLVLIAVALLLWRWAGAGPAMLGSLTIAMLFPLGAAFLPGRPDELGWAMACAILSVLPIAGSLLASATSSGHGRAIVAGVAGGVGLWICVGVQLAVLAGIWAGGVALACLGGRDGSGAAGEPGRSTVAWRSWGVAGAVMVLVAWWIEAGKTPLTFIAPRWDHVQPLYAVAWLGGAEVLARMESWARRGRSAWTIPAIVTAGLGLLAMAALPVAWWRHPNWSLAQPNDLLARVSDLPGEGLADGIAAWFLASGWTLVAVAAAAPLVVALISCALGLASAAGDRRGRAAVLFMLGPIMVTLAAAWFWPAHWTTLAGMLVVLVAPVVVAVRAGARAVRLALGAAAGAALLAGAWVAVPGADQRSEGSVSRAEVQGLIERDLAWWMAAQAPESGAIVLAPPDLTAALIYHGGLRGLGTPYRENEDGFRFSVRLSAATTPDEGQALVESRGVRYIVVPSWDGFLDEYARLGANQPENSLIALLHRWLPPRWLRPVAYAIPNVEGFEGESVVVFQVVDLQDNPTALSRLAEYFLETGRHAEAARLGAALKELLPTEPAAHVARAQVAVARRDAGAFRELVQDLVGMVDDGSAESLTWDRRVSLALLLAQARLAEAAQAQVQRTLDELDEPGLRSLSNRTLQRYLALLKSLGLDIADPEMRALAERLLPAEMRSPP